MKYDNFDNLINGHYKNRVSRRPVSHQGPTMYVLSKIVKVRQWLRSKQILMIITLFPCVMILL